MINIIRIIVTVVLIGLLMGKGIMDAIVHITAWVMTKLSEIGYFSISPKFDYMEFYEAHAGEPDIEH